ncbi:MAG: hypothetical protein Q8942_13265 [Bacillota bacterium]|nr:hypothetical protein [Bacillota bacterium]
MNRRHLRLGILLLLIGVAWMLVNFKVIGYMNITALIASVIKFLPLILIVIGINMFFKNNSIVKAISWILYFVIIISYSIMANPKIGINGADFNINLGNDNSLKYVTYSEKLNNETKNGEANISLGAVKIDLNSDTEDLLYSKVPSNIKLKKVDYSDGYTDAKIKFDKQSYFDFGSGNKSCVFKLNKNILWDMNLNTGAVNGTLDMKDMKIKSLDLSLGAGNMDIIFGAKHDDTKVKINAGASNLNITAPKSSGIRVKLQGGLNHTNLDKLDFDKHGDVYESNNYEKAECKIDMEIDMGVSGLNLYLSE